jgi:hypothetical protein
LDSREKESAGASRKRSNSVKDATSCFIGTHILITVVSIIPKSLLKQSLKDFSCAATDQNLQNRVQVVLGTCFHFKNCLTEGALRPLVFACLDCEMMYTITGLDVGRISAVDWNENIILDVLVRPDSKIIDFNTIYSGISGDTFEKFENIVNGKQYSIGSINLNTLKGLISKLFDKNTIICGFALQNDMKALNVHDFYNYQWIHDSIIDVSKIYNGDTNNFGLKQLSCKHLRQFIQDGSLGHSSVQDAKSTLRLLKHHLTQATPS